MLALALMTHAVLTLAYNDVSTGDSKAIIRFVVLLGIIWLVVGLLFLIPGIPAVGRTIMMVAAGLFSLLLMLNFFGLV